MIRRMTPMTHSNLCFRRCVLSFSLLLATGIFSGAAAQSADTTKTESSQPSSPPVAKQSAPQEKADADNATAQKPAKARKVITNDDIEAAHARAARESGEDAKAGGTPGVGGQCDEDCAFEARQQLGYGPEREGEWQMQLTIARRNLGMDARWRQANFELSEAVQLYCQFVYQQQKTPVPTGNDFNSLNERARRQQYAQDMGRTLSQKLSNATAAMNRLIQETRQLEPVRATVMSVLQSRLLNSCAYVYDP
jgi:hypothetical protein